MVTFTPHGRTAVGTVRFDPLTRWEAAEHVRDELTRGRGGQVMVLSHEQLRQLNVEPDADVVLAGSATAVWASRLAGTPLPERITGAALTDALCAAANADNRRVYLIGGLPATAGLPSAAGRAAAILGIRHQGLRVCGGTSPTGSVAVDERVLATALADLVEAKPDLVLIGVDQPAAEAALVAAVRSELDSCWLFSSLGLIRELTGDPGQPGSRRVHVSYSARLLARAAATRVSHTLHR